MIVFTHQRTSHNHFFGSDVSLKSWVLPSKSSVFFLVHWILFPAKAHKNPDTNLLNTRGVKSPLREREFNWKKKKNHKSRPLSSLNWQAFLWPWFFFFPWNVFASRSWMEKLHWNCQALAFPLTRVAGVCPYVRQKLIRGSLQIGQAEKKVDILITQVFHLMGTQGCQVSAITIGCGNKFIWSIFVSISSNLIRNNLWHGLWRKSGYKVIKMPSGGRVSEDSQRKMLQKYGLQIPWTGRDQLPLLSSYY